MWKLAMAVGALVGVGVAVRRLAARTCSQVDLGKVIAAMPDNAPPKWVYTNVTAIRDNTERILTLLQERAPVGAGTGPERTV